MRIKTKSQWKRIPNSLCRYSILSITSYSSSCGPRILTSFQKVQEKRVTLQWRNLESTTWARWSRSTSAFIMHIDTVPLMWSEKITLPLWSSSPKHRILILSGEKWIKQTPEWAFYKFWLTQNCPRHPNQGVWETINPKRSLRKNDN